MLSAEPDRIPGIDTQQLTRWLESNLAAISGPVNCQLIAGGRSNLTYELSDASGHRMVLRRPPLGRVLRSAHDMGREHRIIGALKDSAVPVPRTIAHCVDETIIGSEFYLMDFVDGAILRAEADVESSFPVAQRAPVADSLIDTLSSLHEISPADVGLADLSRHDGYVERQLRRWQRQWELSRSRENPTIEEVHRRLSARIPHQQRTAIVHGDYRIDNLVFGADTRVAAVLDWELCTLGDQLADLGLLMVYWVQAGEDTSFMLSGTPTRCDGFPGRDHLLERYAANGGVDLAEIDFYIAFGYWKLACIAEGIYARYSAGAMGEDSVSTERLVNQVPVLAEAALAAVERL
jgi:aminoglycoside phosphotransferase (APT) family kinase protein